MRNSDDPEKAWARREARAIASRYSNGATCERLSDAIEILIAEAVERERARVKERDDRLEAERGAATAAGAS